MNRHERGIAMIELIVYIAIMIVLTLIMVGALVNMSGTFRAIEAASRVDIAAQTSLERMIRDIRAASSIDLALSTLDMSPGVLQLNTTDRAGAATTEQFFMVGTSIHIKKAGVDTGPLTSSSVHVSKLTFRRLTSTQSEGVRIELTIDSGAGVTYRTKFLYATVILRGSYPLQ